ncbi:helix-turn-helix domain-containing protein [Streptomyces sp. NPDC088736]|uniref:helix-turn-helix domain-containing protein n=1 Tax=Streptomyces sp. NPDC088736 TaxID=3365881 RepID=UPI00381C0449
MLQVSAPESGGDSDSEDALLKPAEVAKIVRLSVKTLANRRALGSGPPYRKLSTGRGGRIRYPKVALMAWLDEHRVSTP